MEKEVLGFIAALLGILGFLPYSWSIYKGETKPHMFSWIPWTLTTAVAFAGQVAEHGGPGVWATGTSAVLSGVIMVASFFKGEKSITRKDWFFFLLSLATIPLWIATKEPLASVVLATFINLSAIFPTVRKSWHKPDEEAGTMYILLAVRSALSITALEVYDLTTVLFPVAQLMANIAIFSVIFGRRVVLR